MADWAARSTEAGVVVAYDFSAPPANGGDWKWGSLKASPHITCYAQNQDFFPYARVLDTSVFPPGSTASLRWDVEDYSSGQTVLFSGPVNGATSGTMLAPFLSPHSNPFPARFSDGSTRNVTITGLSVTWSGALPASPPIASMTLTGEGAGERSDLWWISIDDYVDQFGDNGEFWIQWRTRMNSTMATFKFVDRNDEVSPTTYKQLMVGEGMQSGGIGMNPAWPYGYRGVGTSQSSNQLNGMRVDFEGETNFIAQTGADGSTTATTIFKYPSGYHGKPGYTSMVTKGTDTSYFTHHNSGNEAAHVAACQYQINGLGIPNRSSCFVYPTDEWFTMMVHVKLGARGHGFSSMNVGVGSAPATRQAANQVLLTTSTWVEHFNPAASAGLYIRIRGSATGTVDARVTVKDTTTFTGKTLLTLSGVTGTIQDEALLVDEYENGFVNSTIEYHGANSGGAMQLLHRRTGVVMRVGNYVYDSVGYSPMAKYGTFAWTTFMTRKSLLQTHAVGKIWVSQIIIKSGATPPSTPA